MAAFGVLPVALDVFLGILADVAGLLAMVLRITAFLVVLFAVATLFIVFLADINDFQLVDFVSLARVVR